MPDLTLEQRITQIEDEIRKTPYHKGTEHHIGKLKARAAKLKDEVIEKKSKSSGGGGGYAVKKTGDATVVLVGPPSVGKSTLLNQLTNADSKVASYDFTTLDVIPGMLDYNGAKIQIFDVPGILTGAASGKGRGREVLSVARNADLIVVIVDLKTVNKIPSLLNELYEAGVRINDTPPRVRVIKQSSGGIKVNSISTLRLSEDTVKELANEFRIPNAEIIIKEDLSIDRLVDSFMGNRAYLPYLIVVNKSDTGKLPKDILEITKGENPIFLSAQNNINLDEFKKMIWEKLSLIRIYLKEDEVVDKEDPLIIKYGKTINELLEKLAIRNKDLIKAVRVFGKGAKYPGQEVSFNFVPEDETVLQFIY